MFSCDVDCALIILQANSPIRTVSFGSALTFTQNIKHRNPKSAQQLSVCLFVSLSERKCVYSRMRAPEGEGKVLFQTQTTFCLSNALQEAKPAFSVFFSVLSLAVVFCAALNQQLSFLFLTKFINLNRK
jgi:uncharacterized Fe-S radical SAM superfamily protein PflX